MIIKSMSRKKGIKQLLNYIFKEEKEEKNQTTPSFKRMTIKHNVTGTDINRWTKQFEFNESLRKAKRVDQVRIYHEVLSFSVHDREHINGKLLRDISKKYIQERGPQNMFVMSPHVEKDHIHIHVAVSGSQFLNGRANRMSKKAFEKMRVNMEEYQKNKYPELKHSIVYAKQSKDKKTDIKDRRYNNKHEIDTILNRVFEKAKSIEEFETTLKTLGHTPYYRNNVLTGVAYNGEMKFRFSKLGFDREKLDRLQEQENEIEKNLAELDELRNNGKDKEKESSERDRFVEEEVLDESEDNWDIDDYER